MAGCVQRRAKGAEEYLNSKRRISDAYPSFAVCGCEPKERANFAVWAVARYRSISVSLNETTLFVGQFTPTRAQLVG